jgi:hypothetical protein
MACWVGRWVAAIRVTGDGPAASGDGVGATGGLGCFLGEFGVLVDDDHQRGRRGGGFPDAGAVLGEGGGAGVEDADGVGEQVGGLVWCGGQPVQAGRPGL